MQISFIINFFRQTTVQQPPKILYKLSPIYQSLTHNVTTPLTKVRGIYRFYEQIVIPIWKFYSSIMTAIKNKTT
jgi:hypothetical protein